MKKITRIAPPKFKVGKYVLNEYELRTMLLEVCRGERESGFKIVGDRGEISYALPDGSLSCNLGGLAINSLITLEVVRIKRERMK